MAFVDVDSSSSLQATADLMARSEVGGHLAIFYIHSCLTVTLSYRLHHQRCPEY